MTTRPMPSAASQVAADMTGIAQLGEPEPVAQMIVDGDDDGLQARLDARQRG